MSTLRVRAYNILQGDAFLITVPDKGSDGVETKRHILIDVGTLNRESLYKEIVENVLSVTGQKPVDLYVMTHEHVDHVEGLNEAKKKHGLDLKADYAWLTASAGPDYYDTHQEAKRKLDLARKSVRELSRYLEAIPDDLPETREMLRMNNFETTDKCVDHLREIAPENRTYYVHRKSGSAAKHPFKEAKLKILAPEENTADYYLGIQTRALGVSGGGNGSRKPSLERLLPPAGVDASAFHQLVESRRESYIDGLLSIDKASNNTSVVLSLKWRGWNLLFPGDAEQESWEIMYKKKQLEPVDFLKVGHHGSHTATPEEEKILNKILPVASKAEQALGVIPVGPTNTFGHPHKEALKRLKGRCNYDITYDLEEGGWYDYEFPG